MIRLNIVYDMLQTTKISSNTIEDNEILQPIDKIYFVICNSCYWCASYFGIDDLESLSESSSHVLDCHICNSHNTELMPISSGESFRIELVYKFGFGPASNTTKHATQTGYSWLVWPIVMDSS